MSGAPRGKVEPKAKDASTRFMRVDQLGSAQTVAMPAAQMLAAATRAMPLAVADTLPAPTVVQRRLDERATVALASLEKRPARPRSRRRWARGRVRMAVATSLVIAIVSLASAWKRETAGWAGLAKRAQATRTVTSEPTSEPPSTSTSHATARAPAAGTTTVLPATAADQLAAGDYAAALTSYQQLARDRPEEPAFALVAQVLDRKRRARCIDAAAHGGPSCVP